MFTHELRPKHFISNFATRTQKLLFSLYLQFQRHCLAFFLKYSMICIRNDIHKKFNIAKPQRVTCQALQRAVPHSQSCNLQPTTFNLQPTTLYNLQPSTIYNLQSSTVQSTALHLLEYCQLSLRVLEMIFKALFTEHLG